MMLLAAVQMVLAIGFSYLVMATDAAGGDVFEGLEDKTYLGEFKFTTHEVQGQVYYDNTNGKIFIHRFYYDGKGPGPIQFRFVPRGVDAYEDGTPVAVEERLVVGPDGSLESVGITSEVLNENLNLVLPEGSTVNDLDRLVFWCDLYGVSFGRMDVDEKGPTKQFFLGQRRPKEAERYVGPFVETQHGIAGDVYIIDNSTLYIADFNYDGQGPSVVFFGGEEEDVGRGVQISYPYRRNIGILGVRKLKAIRKRDITINLPPKLNANQMVWMSVWCDTFQVSFGHVLF